MNDARGNIVLVGMPGSGKSTVGVLLAKALGMGFVDTDVVIQTREKRTLQDIINAEGMAAFCALEQRHVLSLHFAHTVVATGGSVIYGEQAMAHLKAQGDIVLLDVNLPELQRRLANLAERGVVMAPGQTLADLYQRRHPLYHRWADVVVACSDLRHEDTVAAVADAWRTHHGA